MVGIRVFRSAGLLDAVTFKRYPVLLFVITVHSAEPTALFCVIESGAILTFDGTLIEMAEVTDWETMMEEFIIPR